MTTRDLYLAHRPFVRRCLRRLGVPEGGLDDAVQDVFVVLVRRFDAVSLERGVRGWLFGVSRRVAWAHRRRAARVTAEVEVPLRPPQEASAAVNRLLERLDDGQLEVLVLAEVEGCTAREIAGRLGLPITTVQWRLRGARRRLREAESPARQRASAWLPIFGRHGVGSSVLAPAATALFLVAVKAPVVSVDGPTATVSERPHEILHVVPWTPPPRQQTQENDMTIATIAIAAAMTAAPPAPGAPDRGASNQDADAAAYQGKKGTTAIYIFDNDDVEGVVWRPTGENIHGPGTVRHASLLKLRAHFNTELVDLSLEL